MNALTSIDATAMSATLAPQDHEGVQMFDARALHGWLDVSTPFSKWMVRRVDEYRFDEGSDYQTFLSVRSDGKAGRRTRQYLITIDMAKELAMVERTEKGRETRRYFIEMEKAAREMAGTLVAQGQPEAIHH